MKRLFLLVMLVFLMAPIAEAKRRETPEEIEQKSRHYSGWEWGAAGRVNLLFYNLDKTVIMNQRPSKVYIAKADVGGSVMLNGEQLETRLGDGRIYAEGYYDDACLPHGPLLLWQA